MEFFNLQVHINSSLYEYGKKSRMIIRYTHLKDSAFNKYLSFYLYLCGILMPLSDFALHIEHLSTTFIG